MCSIVFSLSEVNRRGAMVYSNRFSICFPVRMIMVPPLVSVLIPTKNGGFLFDKVLKKVINQKTSWEFEIIIIDSGSTDSTIDSCNSYNKVKLYKIDTDSFGHGKTRNLGVSMASGKYIALLTQDALPIDEYWLHRLVLTVEQDEQIAGVFGKHIAYPNANPFTAHELDLHFKNFDNANSVYYIKDREKYYTDERYRQSLHFFSDNNALIRRSVWEECPYPEVDFAEDQIWAKTILEAGYKKAYSSTAAVYHSHDYTLFERLQRSFDEAYAYKTLFNYSLSKDLRHLLTSWLYSCKRDMLYAYKHHLFKSNPGAVAKSPVDNLMKLAGHYLGTRAKRIPRRFHKYLSRDKQVQLGTITKSEY